MIKKAVLLILTAPFLMVFSSSAFSSPYFTSSYFLAGGQYGSPSAACSNTISIYNARSEAEGYTGSWHRYRGVATKGDDFTCITTTCYENPEDLGNPCPGSSEIYTIEAHGCAGSEYCDSLRSEPDLLPKQTDEQCQSDNGDTISVSASSANYLNGGGSVKTHGGACSISGTGGVTACTGTDDNISCSLAIESTSTGEYGEFSEDSNLNGGWGEGDGTFSVVEFNAPDYLNEVPGGCTDPSSCVTIGDTSYLVDWDSAPDYFEYVDANGNTHSKSSSGGGGSGGDTGGGDTGGGSDPTDPTDPGDDNGGGDTGGGDDSGNDDADDNDGGGGSGGGSTVPDFEFDESGIIEAIGSAGRSNRNSIDALSEDVTGAISSQTDDLIASNDAHTEELHQAIEKQTTSTTAALDDQTDTLTDSLDALGTTFTDALKGLGLGSIGDDTGDGDSDGEGEGEGEDGEGDGLLGGISKLLNRMVDKIASTFTEDLGDGEDLFDSSGMDDTLDGAAVQEEQHSDDVNALMDEIGEGATSGIADQVTSRLPSLPSGGCTPIAFGPIEISCRPFDLIKSWLTWIIYFWTVVSIVDTFFRSGQRTA